MNRLSNRTNIKIPNVLQVIRKKNQFKPTESYWLNTQLDKDTYYSNILEDKLYLYAFLNDRSAKQCYSFLQKYKAIYGEYPSTTELKQPTKFGENGEIYIDTDTAYSLSYRGLLNNIGIMGITTFEYTYCETFLERKNVFNLTVSGVDLLEDETIDSTTMKNHLNYLFRF